MQHCPPRKRRGLGARKSRRALHPPSQGPGGTTGRWRQTTTETAPPKCARGTSGHPPLNGGFFAPSCEALEEIGRRGSNARGGPHANNNRDGGE
ncbi:hypothetical protein IscW_ISCW010828 [Ixodes scapularis]|uniref:Uncharacterized protein n=1 Tax=Ixodes scapularis TaxID=6945 RepID=B7Q9F0_IXOSC|nr:hypothetical protein IscW_ISCW010828 [Ixodes scapularis]|eukprot:XP_002405831.1 hypothetical protein IscW_ISCW010828 [Ixodes scapularis]